MIHILRGPAPEKGEPSSWTLPDPCFESACILGAARPPTGEDVAPGPDLDGLEVLIRRTA